MLFMGLVCNTIGQLPPAFLVPRPTRHMSHESTDNVCCRRTTDYCHATGHHQSTTTPARSSATILILHLFQGCTWRRKHCGRRPAGGSGSGSIASLFHPAECPPRALKTQSQRQSRGMTIGIHTHTNTISLTINPCAPVACTRLRTFIPSNQASTPSTCLVIPSLAWSGSPAQVYRQYGLLCDGRGADRGPRKKHHSEQLDRHHSKSRCAYPSMSFLDCY
jgi:hypothetical protein